MTRLASAPVLGLDRRMAEDDGKKRILPTWQEYVAQKQIVLLPDRVVIDLVDRLEKENAGDPAGVSGGADGNPRLSSISKPIKGETLADEEGQVALEFLDFKNETAPNGASTKNFPIGGVTERLKDECDDIIDDILAKPRESDALPLPEGDEKIYGFCPAQENNTFTRCKSIHCGMVRKPNLISDLEEHRLHRSSDHFESAKPRASQARISEKPSKKRKSSDLQKSKPLLSSSAKKSKKVKSIESVAEEPAYTPDAAESVSEMIIDPNESSDPKKRRYLPCKDRKYDPDLHCGVVDQSGRPCTRSLTCKTHPIMYRRAVKGRFKGFDELLADQRAAKDRPKEEAPRALEEPRLLAEPLAQPLPPPPILPTIQETVVVSPLEVPVPSPKICSILRPPIDESNSIERESIVVVLKITDPKARTTFAPKISSPPRLQLHPVVPEPERVELPEIKEEAEPPVEDERISEASSSEDEAIRDGDLEILDNFIRSDFPAEDRHGPRENVTTVKREYDDDATMKYLRRQRNYCQIDNLRSFSIFEDGRKYENSFKPFPNGVLDSCLSFGECPSSSEERGKDLKRREEYLKLVERVLAARIPEQPRYKDEDEVLIRSQIEGVDEVYNLVDDDWQPSPAKSPETPPPSVISISG